MGEFFLSDREGSMGLGWAELRARNGRLIIHLPPHPPSYSNDSLPHSAQTPDIWVTGRIVGGECVGCEDARPSRRISWW